MDDVLVGLGRRLCETQAKYVRTLQLPSARSPAGEDDDDIGRGGVSQGGAKHIGFSARGRQRDRLAAMNLPIPAPTPEQDGGQRGALKQQAGTGCRTGSGC